MKDRKGKGYFKYLNYLFEDMYSVKSKFYPDSTFFKKNDKVILELEKSGTLWVLYSVWTDISNMFSYDYEETQQLIKEWVEAQLKKGKVELFIPIESRFQRVESQLKKELVAPLRASGAFLLRTAIVEEKFKSGVVVPEGFLDGGFTQVEKQLNSEEVTPLDAGSNYLPFMEKQLKSEEVIPHTSITNQLMRVQEESKQEEVTPQHSIPLQSWRDLEKEEITPRNAIAPPFRWRNLDSVKYVEIKPNVPLSTYHLKVVEEQLKSEGITPRQVVSASFDWIQEQINLGEVTPTSFFVIK